MKIAKILAAGGKPPARQQLNNFICPGIQNEFLQGGRTEQNPTESRSLAAKRRLQSNTKHFKAILYTTQIRVERSITFLICIINID